MKLTESVKPVDVTLVQLIASPERFDGKLIRVIGFLEITFEGNVLYLHREDYENAILGNGIWVNVTPEMFENSKSLSRSYVLLEGIFSAIDRGHQAVWSGTLKHIRRAEFWRAGNKGANREESC